MDGTEILLMNFLVHNKKKEKPEGKTKYQGKLENKGLEDS
jgi:hypothetical protein